MSNILVSIHCATYNHEKHIADAIDSFIMQQTNFKYEILIHDDASTDRTAEIIREYEKKYPELIKPIYQTENQQSKGRSVTQLNLERAKGKYVAICEGDDYWTDLQKLQKQVAYMEDNPQCSLCVHAGFVVNATNKNLESISRPSKTNKVFTTEEVIEGGGGLFLTNSMLYLRELNQKRPKFYSMAPVGDYPLVINLSLLGKVYYIDEFMSAYRVGVTGSWTATNYSSIEKKYKHLDEIVLMLDELNEYTNYQFEDAVKKTKCIYQFNLLLEQRKFKEAKTGEFRDFYKKIGVKRKIIIFLYQYLPVIRSKYIKGIWLRWAMK